MLYWILTFIIIIIITYIYNGQKEENHPLGLMKVPFVAGSLPIVGHGIAFSRDIIGFIKNQEAIYGKIFKIKVFRKTIIVCTDHELKDEFFAAHEDEMSLYSVLESLYFGDAFSDNCNNLTNIINVVKKTIKIKFDEFAPKILSEATKMIERMKLKSGQTINLKDDLIRFISFTSAKCFINIELDDEFFDLFMKFTNLTNRIVILTYFFPKSLLHFIFDPIMRKYRRYIINKLSPEIEKYRMDKTKNDSLVIRGSVDYNNGSLSNKEIGEIIICLLYVSSENTALGLSAAMIDLASNPQHWNKLRSETQKYILNGDIKSLFAEEYLNACIMESARINTHIFPIVRKGYSKKSIGGYYIGDADCLAMCEPLMMVHYSESFKNPTLYNPERFIGIDAEPKDSKEIMTWGSGIHLCPGKQFALYEIKTAMALLVNNFNIFKFVKLSPLNYFSPSAFAERDCHVIIENLPLNEQLKMEMQNFITVNYDNKKYNLQLLKDNIIAPVQGSGTKSQHIADDNISGWLIRDYFTNDEQEDIYNYLIMLSENSVEHENILTADSTKPYPFAYYNLVYTNTSNCDIPIKLFEICDTIWDLLRTTKNIYFNKDKIEFNSMYAQLFGSKSILHMHKDEYVDWGISINLGASCEFMFNNEKIILNSGDVFIADFSKYEHGVLKILDNTIPTWFDSEINNNIKTFGRIRCSIQIRNVPSNSNVISFDNFYHTINQTN